MFNAGKYRKELGCFVVILSDKTASTSHLSAFLIDYLQEWSKYKEEVIEFMKRRPQW